MTHPKFTAEESSKLVDVLIEVSRERERQQAKFGQQNCPDSDPVNWGRLIPPASQAKVVTDARFAAGGGTWADILVEEVAEAHDEADAGAVDRLRAELVQVAAVAVAWIEAIDRRIVHTVNTVDLRAVSAETHAVWPLADNYPLTEAVKLEQQLANVTDRPRQIIQPDGTVTDLVPDQDNPHHPRSTR